MLKLTTLILSIVVGSSSALASTHGGGVLMDSLSEKRNDIVYHIRTQQGVVKFAYAHLENKQWQIQNLEMPETELFNNTSVLKALQNSALLNNWSEVR